MESHLGRDVKGLSGYQFVWKLGKCRLTPDTTSHSLEPFCDIYIYLIE